MKPPRRAGDFLFIRLFVFGKTEDIIHARAVMPRKLYKHLCRNIKVAALVIAVNALTAAKYLGKLALFEVAVLAQLAYSSVICHFFSPIVCRFGF